MKPPNVAYVKVVGTLVDAARELNRRAAERESTERLRSAVVVAITAQLERERAARAAKEAECGGGASEARARPVVLPNGTYMLTPEQGVSVTLDVVASEARYRNSVGHYFADRDGFPICGRVDFTDAKASIGGSATSDYALGEIPAEAVSVGIFIVPNGKELNPLLPDRAPVVFSRTDRAHWAAYYALCGPEAGAEAGAIHGAGAAAYFVDASLNHDMCSHTRCGHASSSSGAAAQEVGFEDVLGVGSDNEYRDVVVSVRLAAREESEGEHPLTIPATSATSATSVHLRLHTGAVRLATGAGFRGVALTSTSIGATGSGSGSDDEARRHTSVGHYFADRDGVPIYARVDWVDFPTDADGRPTYGSCVTYAPRDIPAGAETAGFFSVALRLAPSTVVAFAVDDGGLVTASTASTPRGEALATVVFSDAPSWLRTSVSALPQDDDEPDENARRSHSAAHAPPHVEPPD